MKIICIFGTRPEAIKLAPIIYELKRKTEETPIQSIVCVTGQHREMLDQVLSLFDIETDYDLNVMADNQTPTQVASAVLAKLEPILDSERPDWVLVQGDTTTVAAAALASFYKRIKVGHVEAGLRTWDKWQPFPEEINRKVTSAIADRHFAPTVQSRQNLLDEGVHEDQVLVTGNPVIDALKQVVKIPASNEIIELLQQCGISIDGDRAQNVVDHSPKLSQPSLILVTAHRRENFGRPLINICEALLDLATSREEQVHIIYPVHMNPNVWDPVHRILGDVPNITLTPPLDYLSLVHLMKNSHLVLTDSGGIQEEAPGLGKPVLVLRAVTERPEAVDAGTVLLVGSSRKRIVSEVSRLLDDKDAYERMARAVNPYGDGHAAERIVASLLDEPVVPFQVGGIKNPA